MRRGVNIHLAPQKRQNRKLSQIKKVKKVLDRT